MGDEQVGPIHAMYREIYEQPRALAQTLARYTVGLHLRQEAFGAAAEWLSAKDGLILAASGSSRHAALAAEIMLEDLAGLAVDVEYASEYAARSTHPGLQPALGVISQSGETADTLAALGRAMELGLPTLAITNLESSSMARAALISLPTCAGVEKAIPATKSFTSQLLVLYLLALFAAQHKGTLSELELQAKLHALAELPGRVAAQLPAWEEEARRVAAALRDSQTLLYLGRGVHYAIAREGALKTKESAYLHAEGYPAGELKHGPNALVSPESAVVVLATHDAGDAGSMLRYEKTLQLLRDLGGQGATTVVVTNRGDLAARAVATYCIEVSPEAEHLLPLAEVVPLQLLSYFLAVQRGIDVDHPRNLVKAVTTE